MLDLKETGETSAVECDWTMVKGWEWSLQQDQGGRNEVGTGWADHE